MAIEADKYALTAGDAATAEDRETTRASSYYERLMEELPQEELERRLEAVMNVSEGDRERDECPACANDTLLANGYPDFSATCLLCSYVRTSEQADELSAAYDFDRAMAKND